MSQQETAARQADCRRGVQVDMTMATTRYHIHGSRGITATTTDPERADRLSRAGYRVYALTVPGSENE